MFWLQQLTETGVESAHTILTPATGRCFALFCYGVCTKKWCMFQPRWPQDLTWKVGKPRYKSPDIKVNRSWKKWWFRRHVFFLYGVCLYDFRGYEIMRLFFALAESIFVMDCRRFIDFMDTSTDSKFSMVFQSNCWRLLWNVPKSNHSVCDLFGVFSSWPFQRWIVTSVWVIKRLLGRSCLVDFLASCFGL